VIGSNPIRIICNKQKEAIGKTWQSFPSCDHCVFLSENEFSSNTLSFENVSARHFDVINARVKKDHIKIFVLKEQHMP